ncbi:hypothetical protein CMUS01_15696 [Colletotrichum musicola]|uniref:Xylanolytic transcriptional activator regulatory domain-containing protein n=1 Tax=Colletotrichum musicola TaxID=2175873 RepID=A0A8H6IV09_9PEZI|nr:hypothetical protein CMUS01_15696 [Colletotrichum musicola]
MARFFRHVYPVPLYSFLHEESIMQRCLGDNLPEALNLAICAISVLHLQDHRYHPAATVGWIRRAESILWSHIEHPTIFRTQALLLVIQYRIETGEFRKAFMLSSIASRAASALRLHYERTDIHPLAQEVRRRLMWCLIMMDMRFSSGLPECELCPFENVYLNQPSSEEEFSALHHTGRDRNETNPHNVAEDGLLSLLIRQASLRRDISRLKRQVSLAGNPVPQLEDLVHAFKRNLEQLPIAPYRLKDLREYSRSRWLLRYILAHLSWHQCHCDLYRLFLSGYKEAAPDVVTGSVSPGFTENAVSVCLHHAQTIVAILHDVTGLEDADLKVVDNDVAICSYHASRIIIFISGSRLKPPDSNITTESALEKARSTLAILRRLYKNSTLAKYILSDLEAVIQDPTTTAAATTDEDAPEEGQPSAPKRPRFARRAQKHQNLAVHSVLRHALFVDDSHRAAGHSEKQAKKPEDPPGSNAAGKDFSQDEDRSHAAGTNMIHSRYDAFGGLALETDVLPDAAGGGFMGLPSQSFNEPSGFSFWGNWNETWGPNEWPMGSDENYF